VIFPVMFIREQTYQEMLLLLSRMDLGKHYTLRQLSSLVGLSVRQTQHRLNALIKQGEVEKTGWTGKQGRQVTRRLYARIDPRTVALAKSLLIRWVKARRANRESRKS